MNGIPNIFPPIILCVFLFVSCRRNEANQTSAVELDSIEFDGLFFAGEEIVVKANDSVVFFKKIDSLKKFGSIYGEFMIPKSDTTTLSVQVFFNSKNTIDTIFAIPPFIFINSIGGSICYPSYLSEDSVNKILQPHFGFIPVDSCRRYFTLMPDSIMYKYPN